MAEDRVHASRYQFVDFEVEPAPFLGRDCLSTFSDGRGGGGLAVNVRGGLASRFGG